jgi:hypothetical protein
VISGGAAEALDLDRDAPRPLLRGDQSLGREIDVEVVARVAEVERVASDGPPLGDERIAHGVMIAVAGGHGEVFYRRHEAPVHPAAR